MHACAATMRPVTTAGAGRAVVSTHFDTTSSSSAASSGERASCMRPRSMSSTTASIALPAAAFWPRAWPEVFPFPEHTRTGRSLLRSVVRPTSAGSLAFHEACTCWQNTVKTAVPSAIL
eukprot:365313-Chlamydomonas_euryale.AAC.35